MLYDTPSDSHLIGVQDSLLGSCRKLGYSLLLQPCKHDQPELIEEVRNELIIRDSTAAPAISKQ